MDINNKFPEALLNAPGLPGQIASYINSTAIKRQPVLALGAAICAAGTIFAHRIRSDSNLRTNFLVLSIAESGCGKEGARQSIIQLFNKCELNNYMLGDFVSDSGILTGLRDNKGIGFAMIDEIGREIQALNNKRSNSHEQRIMTTVMKLFSQAGGTYRGKQYANVDSKFPRFDIEQPCLNVYGTTVPKRFYEALTSDEAIDGFLARWLVFKSDDIDPPLQEFSHIAPPDDLIKDIAEIQAMPAYEQLTVNGVVLSDPVPIPKIIPFSDTAKDILQNLTFVCNEKRKQEIKNGGVLAPIWARTREHAIKLALVAHPFEHGIIESVTMQWACDLALYLSNVSINAIRENISDNEHERTLRRVHSVIKRYNDNNHNKPMPNKKLIQATAKFLNVIDRGKVLFQLSEAGFIDIRETGKTYDGKPCYEFIANDYSTG